LILAEGSSGNRALWIGVIVIAVAAVAGAAFYAGRHTAEQDAMRPIAQRAGLGGPHFTRLPPKQFGNWTLACVLDAQQTKHCTLVFQAVDNTRRHLLMRIAVVRTNKGRIAMAILTPPNALVAAGVKLTPGNNPVITVPFLRCMPRACQASLLLTDPFVKSLSGSDSTQVSFVAGTGKPVSYKLPTQGFKDGYAAWLVENPASTTIDATAPDNGPVAAPAATPTEEPAAKPTPAKRTRAHTPTPAPKEPPATP
jgi:invasion protein IalB